MRYDYEGVIADYDTGRDEWVITDTTRAGVQARTQDTELAYHATVAFAAEGPPSYGVRDTGDEDRNA